MNVRELLAWQWSDYAGKHRNRVNLLIHIVAIPLFMLGCVIALVALFKGLGLIFLGLLAMALSVVVQGVGHKFETVRPAPFKGFPDFVRRVFFEQWVTFPRYVLSGGWSRAVSGKAGTE